MPHPEDKKSFPFNRPGNYRIRVLGLLDEGWSERLAGMRITTEELKDHGSSTALVGQIRDQAELSGVLNTLYDLHMTLLSVEYINKD